MRFLVRHDSEAARRADQCCVAGPSALRRSNRRLRSYPTSAPHYLVIGVHCAASNIPFCASTRVHELRELLNPKFLFHFLQTRIATETDRLQTGEGR